MLRTVLCIGLGLLAVDVNAGDAQSSEAVSVGGHRFRAEIARTDDERSRGLMFRERLADDAGMLFLFESEQPLAFWMKNTQIALDILYFDKDGRLVSLQRDVPPCRTARCRVYPSDRPSQFVLELNSGTSQRLGIQLGDALCWSRDLGPSPAACHHPID